MSFPASRNADAEFSMAILRWSEANLRDLPWRSTRDPWKILVSEVMAQQTQLTRVIPRWSAFVVRWPTEQAFAAESFDEVLRFWKGLGYPRRARALWDAAHILSGRPFPTSEHELRQLPGVGRYTASALLAFAFELDVAVVDTNVGRILARQAGESLTTKALWAKAEMLVPFGSAFEYNSAMLDVGAMICRPKVPNCEICPVSASCKWLNEGDPVIDPAKGSAAVSKPQKRFEGSDRQRRGRVLHELAGSAKTEAELLAALESAGDRDGARRLLPALRSLVADGLIEITTGDEQPEWSLVAGRSS